MSKRSFNRTFQWFGACLFSLGLTCTALAATPLSPATAVQAPKLAAKAFVLMDANSGRILASKNDHAAQAPASLTKLMTLYLTFSELKSSQIQLSDKALISTKAWKMGGSRMFLRSNTRVTIKKLIQGVIVDSGNDACVALAEHVAGSETAFAQMMNAQAQALGMTHTHFVDSTGLPNSRHYSTAYDLALLTRAIIHDFPNQYHFFSQKWFKYNNIKQPNRNRLLWRKSSIDGLKTGHTQAAGYCLIASENEDGMRLISVIMGAKTDAARANLSQQLLNFGFRFFETHTLFASGQSLGQARVWFSKKEKINYGLAKPLNVTIRRGNYSQLKATTALNPRIEAPILKGANMGKLTVSLNGTVIAEQPLLALQADQKGSWFSVMMDKIKLLFTHA